MKAVSWNEGDRVAHQRFGLGTVQSVNGDRIGVQFDAGKRGLFRAEYLRDPSAVSQSACTAWPDGTFVQEAPGATHFMGSHWEPFVDDVRQVMRRLPEFVGSAVVQGGYGESRPAPRPVPAEWTRGFQLVSPTPDRGVALVMQVEPARTLLVSLFPVTQLGCQTGVRLNKVTVWDGGLEAQIMASWGDSEVTFFDTRHVVDRSWYEAGRTYDFILSGLAYQACPAATGELTIPLAPDVIAALDRLLPADERPVEPVGTVRLDGSAWLLPLRDGDADEYRFRGPIKVVTPFKDWLGQDGWRVRVTVMRHGSGEAMKDADLDIHITRRAWRVDAPPMVGQDIEGTLWLQGFLWMPTGPSAA